MTLRRVGVIAVRALAAFLVFGLVFPLAYALVVPEERGTEVALAAAPPGRYRVLVADWGYHTAIILEQPRGWSMGPTGEEHAPFLEYAWGDRRFFMESNYGPHAVFATLALPTESVLYLDGRSDPPALGGARAVFSRTVDAATLHRLLRELERFVPRAPDGTRVASFAAVPGYEGRFYPARGRYLWTRNCNWWTVERLRAASLAGGSAGVIFSGQVAGRLRGFAAGVGAPPAT